MTECTESHLVSHIHPPHKILIFSPYSTTWYTACILYPFGSPVCCFFVRTNTKKHAQTPTPTHPWTLSLVHANHTHTYTQQIVSARNARGRSIKTPKHQPDDVRQLCGPDVPFDVLNVGGGRLAATVANASTGHGGWVWVWVQVCVFVLVCFVGKLGSLDDARTLTRVSRTHWPPDCSGKRSHCGMIVDCSTCI